MAFARTSVLRSAATHIIAVVFPVNRPGKLAARRRSVLSLRHESKWLPQYAMQALLALLSLGLLWGLATSRAAAVTISLPVLTLTATPVSGTSPLSVSFVATCKTCVAYTWAFGDGGIGTGPKQTHVYQTVGTYYPLVGATDKYGNSVTGTAVIDVTPAVVVNPCGKPKYPCVNRSTASIPVPAVPPNAGGPGGANTYMVDPDFHNVIVRVTDYSHTIIPGNTQYNGNYFQAGCGGGSFCNAVNADRTLWKFEKPGGTNNILLRFDPTAFASAVQMIRSAGNTVPSGLPESVFGLYTTT